MQNQKFSMPYAEYIDTEIMNMKENIYTKKCLNCNNLYVGKNKDPFGLCPKCKSKMEEK